MISNNLSDFVGSTEIVSAVRTDHDAISLLDDEEYVNNVTEMIPIWIADGRKELSDDRNVWDWLKYSIRANAVQYSQRKARERSKKESNLENELNEAKSAFENNPSKLNATYYNETRERLENVLEVKTKGVIVRARARWHEHGEKSNKYFFLNLEKKESCQKTHTKATHK